jgi:hypothetical protein
MTRRPQPSAYIRWNPDSNDASLMPSDSKKGGMVRLTRAEVVARYTPSGLNLLITKHGQWLEVLPKSSRPETAIPPAASDPTKPTNPTDKWCVPGEPS